MNKDLLRCLPKIDEVMQRNDIKEQIEKISYERIKTIVQEKIDEVRKAIINDKLDFEDKNSLNC